MNTIDSYSPHPGEFIKEELDARSWNQRDLAYILGCSEQAVNMIISGKRGISSEMAKALGQAFSVPSELFSNLQTAYDLARTCEPDINIAKRARIQSKYPIREMIKRRWIEDSSSSMLETQLARFFEVPAIDKVPHLDHAAKRSQYNNVTPEQLAWLFRIKQIAKSIQTPKYSEKTLRSVEQKFRNYLSNPEEIRHVPKEMMEAGVRFIITEPLPNSKIDGVCFWLDKNSPVIGMSLRHDRIDNFWFVLRHEIEHVLQKNGMQNEIIDVDILENPETSIAEEEKIANIAAADFCVPKKEIDDFIARKNPFFSEKDVLGFSKRIERHPGIIVGQIHAKTQRYELLRKYLIKVRSIITQGAIVDGWGNIFPVNL